MKRLPILALAAALASSPTLAGTPKWETYSCDYQNLAKDISVDGRCHMQQTEINGNFAYVLTWPAGNKVTVEYVKSQSGNHIWKINGKAGVAVEVNRENLRGFTLDLNEFVEWQDRP